MDAMYIDEWITELAGIYTYPWVGVPINGVPDPSVTI